MTSDMRDRLIVALDVPTVAHAEAVVRDLEGTAAFFKVGYQLAFAGGLDFARELASGGKQVFLDMKLLDIANTVERATRNAAASGATFLTVHAHDTKTLRAAAEGRAGTGLRVLGVTVLTSLDTRDLAEQGVGEAPEAVVLRRAKLAKAAGIDGIVASGQEAGLVRNAVGRGFAIVTPGIRFADNAAGDQARITTPQSAIAEGADYLVVGRPITAASSPKAAAERFVAAIAEAQS